MIVIIIVMSVGRGGGWGKDYNFIREIMGK